MTFTRTVVLGIGGWVLGITLLHATLNWGVFDEKPERTGRKKFRVGYLPVT